MEQLRKGKGINKDIRVPTYYFLLEDINKVELIVKFLNCKKLVIDELSYELHSPDMQGQSSSILHISSHGGTSSQTLSNKGEELAIILKGTVQYKFKLKTKLIPSMKMTL